MGLRESGSIVSLLGSCVGVLLSGRTPQMPGCRLWRGSGAGWVRSPAPDDVMGCHRSRYALGSGLTGCQGGSCRVILRAAIMTDDTLRVADMADDALFRRELPLSFAAGELRLADRSFSGSQYLVVLGLPEHRADWLAVSAEALVLRECCYWVSLEGLLETRNSVSVTVSIPIGNIFDSDALVTLIERSRQGL